MSAKVSAPFVVEPKRGLRLRGKATRDGQVWTLVLDAYPDLPQAGFDLVKAQKALEARIGKVLGPRAV